MLIAAVTRQGLADPKRPVVKVEQIIEQLAVIDRLFDPSVNSYDVQYRQERRELDEGDVAGQAKSTGWVEGRYARKGAWLYSHVRYPLPQNKQIVEEYIVWRDRVCVRRFRDSVELFPKILPQAFEFLCYTDGIFADARRLLPWDSDRSQEALGGSGPSHAFFMALPRMIVENRAHYRLRLRLEQVDGVWCHVLEWPGRDVIWVDHSHGCLPRKRTLSLDEVLPAATYFNRELFSRDDGIWLPRSQEQWRYYGRDAPKKLRGKIQSVYQTSLLNLQFNTLTDSFFQVPVGNNERLLIGDGIRHMQYWKEPAGLDRIHQTLGDVQQYQGRGNRAALLLVMGIGAGLLGLLVLVCAIRDQRKA